MPRPSPSGTATYAERISTYATVSTALALHSDRQLGALLDGARHLGTGIGGSAVLLDVDGTPVFAKRVPLTDLERHPDNVMSTANLFDLPPYYQYGVGSAGFGAWRELAAQVMTTNWVLAGAPASFPLLYHWRVLDGSGQPRPTAADRAELDRTVEYWAGSPAVRARLTALAAASTSVVLFLEYVPHTLRGWLVDRLAGDEAAVAAACAMVERELRIGTDFLHAQGFLHFDAHFGNLLTDGDRVYFADLGLAASYRFEVTAAEAEFLRANASHDRCFTVTQLVNRLVASLVGTPGPAERNAYVARCAAGGELPGLPAAAVAVLRRYAPIAVVMNGFYATLHGRSRTTPYPAPEVARACDMIAGSPGSPPGAQPAGEEPR